jgi:hypothetical protein
MLLFDVVLIHVARDLYVRILSIRYTCDGGGVSELVDQRVSHSEDQNSNLDANHWLLKTLVKNPFNLDTMTIFNEKKICLLISNGLAYRVTIGSAA